MVDFNAISGGTTLAPENAETQSVEIMRQCPRYLRCFVPVCPLDLLQDD